MPLIFVDAEPSSFFAFFFEEELSLLPKQGSFLYFCISFLFMVSPKSTTSKIEIKIN
jgi:hypothetical protein